MNIQFVHVTDKPKNTYKVWFKSNSISSAQTIDATNIKEAQKIFITMHNKMHPERLPLTIEATAAAIVR